MSSPPSAATLLPLRSEAVLVALGNVNALLFRALWNRRLADWDRRPPFAGRLQVTLSILIWCAVMSAGRLLAYL
ncbi:hypothetical protein ACFW0H_08695 [Pseudomonas sp. CR3202]|uniref:hypothetical protein n=1 Tax=Pseudomonas sp. CR3202 TaxID=3351532 RepID=UPI003BF2943D